MIHHIVMFRLKETVDRSTADRVYSQFKNAIEALPQEIPGICHIHVGRNVNPEESWDICLRSTFRNLSDLRTYSLHPLHQNAAAALKPYVAQRACTDCED